jgi:hypothetical protein
MRGWSRRHLSQKFGAVGPRWRVFRYYTFDMSDPTDLSLAQIQAESVRIEVRIQRELRRWQLGAKTPATP